MASRLTLLYYDDVSDTKADHQWRELTNRIENPGYDDNYAISASNRPFRYGGGSPILDCNINDRFGAQMEMKLTLNNSGARHSKNWTGSEALGKDPLANGQISQFNGLLPEFTRIIVHETSTYMTLFVGRIYVVEDKFEFPMGNILRLTCRDNLEEVGQADLSSSDEITMTTGSNGVGNYPTSISRQLDVIKEIIKQTTYGGGTNEQEISYESHKIDKGLSHIRAFTAKDISDNPEVKFKKWGRTSPLKIIQNLANLEKWQTGDIDHFGFGFFLDATRTVPYYKITSAINGEGILPQDFTYFRKGYYSTASPATYGLNVTYAQAAKVNENPSGSSDDRTRNMFNDFNFAGFANSSITHIALTHQGHGELGADDVTSHSGDDALNDSTWNKMGGKPGSQSDMRWGGAYDGSVGVKLGGELYDSEDLFTILYVKPLSGDSTVADFTWKVGNPNYSGSDDQWKHQRSFRQVSSLHKSNVGSQTNVPAYRYTGVGGTKTWLGNVQFQGLDGDGNNFLILSHPQEDVINGMDEDDVLYESSTITPLSGCRFDYSPARKRRAKRTVSRTGTDYGTGSNYSIMRNGLAHEFLGSNNKQTDRMRKGYFRISDWPHMRWTNTAGGGSTGNILKPFVGVNVPSDYGMRRGSSVTTTDSNGVKYAGYIYSIDDSAAKTVTAQMFTQSDLDEDSTSSLTQKTWSQNDPYNIYVSLRTGMTIRVDNKLALTVGDHIITSIDYTWSNGHVSSEITTIGINDESLFQSRETLKLESAPKAVDAKEPSVIDAMSLAANAYEARGVMWWHSHIYGASPVLASASLRDYNSFSWSGGVIIVHATNNKYQINPGNTDAQLTYAGYTSPMQANTQYVLYLDRDFPDANARYDIRIAQVTHDDDGYQRAASFLEMAYLTIGEDEDAGEKTIGIPGSSYYSVTISFPNGMPNIQFMNTWSNVLGLDNQIVQANRILQPNSLTTSLLKKGAGRPWASNLSIRGTSYNSIVFDNGSASTDATLTFGNGDTVTIADGTNAGMGDNTTTYMYLDGTSAGLTGTLTPQFTTNHAIAHGDNKLLMAVIAVGVSTQGDKPNILPFNSKQMTINGGVIAADAIIADHVRATTLTTDKFTAAAQTDILNSNSDRAKTFAQDGIPTSVTIGDLWVDTNDGNKIYRAASVGANEITAGEWVLVNSNNPAFTADVNKIFRQSGIPDSENIGDIWIDTDDQAMYFALSVGADAIVTSGTTGWMRRDDVLAINAAETSIEGGLINTARIILKEGGSANPVLLTGAATFSPASGQSYIQMDHASIKGVSRTGTTDTTQFEISAVDGKGRFGGGDVVADSTGLHIATGNANMIHFGTYASEDLFIQRYTGPSGAALRLGGTNSSNIEVVGSLVPGISQGSGGSYLGRNTNVNTAFKGIYLWDATTTPVNGEAGPKFLTYSTANSRLELDGAAIGGGGAMSDWRFTGNSGNNETVTNNELVTFTGQNGITTTRAGLQLTIDGAALASSGHSHSSLMEDWRFTADNNSNYTTVEDGQLLTISGSNGISTSRTGLALTINGSALASSGHNHSGVYMPAGDTSHGTHGGGLSNWEEDGTTFRPTEDNNPQGSTDAYSIGDANYGVGWLHFENSYGIKTNFNDAATTIWETHGHHEFESDVYMKDKLTTEQELVVQNKLELRQGLSSAGNMSLHFTGDTNTGLYRSSIDQMHFSVGGYTGMMIDETSNAVRVGIAGIYSSGYALAVTGETKKTSGGGYWDDYSDDRIKTDVASLSGGMATIAALNPVSYKFTDAWKEAVSSRQHTTQYGFLASEYKTVFPNYTKSETEDLVKVDGKWQLVNQPEVDEDGETKNNELENVVIEEKIEDIMSINEAAIVPHLVAAIKELEARISVLEGN